jgi:hypothetical protein
MKLVIDECLPRSLKTPPHRQHRQNLAGRQVAILILVAQSNQIEDLAPLVPAALTALASIGPGRVAWVE